MVEEAEKIERKQVNEEVREGMKLASQIIEIYKERIEEQKQEMRESERDILKAEKVLEKTMEVSEEDIYTWHSNRIIS